jgi:hypothetical protein
MYWVLCFHLEHLDSSSFPSIFYFLFLIIYYLIILLFYFTMFNYSFLLYSGGPFP